MIHSAKLTKIIELLNHLVRACLSYISVSVFPRKKPVTCPNLEQARSQGPLLLVPADEEDPGKEVEV